MWSASSPRRRCFRSRARSRATSRASASSPSARTPAVTFAQGFPAFTTDARILEAAGAALRDGYNQYATTWGAPQLRQAVARKQSAAWGREVDPETEVTVSCGATEAMIAAMLAAIDPGDEVVVFEPFYENYGPDCIISGAVPRYVTLRGRDWSFDP